MLDGKCRLPAFIALLHCLHQRGVHWNDVTCHEQETQSYAALPAFKHFCRQRHKLQRSAMSVACGAACLIKFLTVHMCCLFSCCCSICSPAGCTRTAMVFIGSELHIGAPPSSKNCDLRYTDACCVQLAGRCRSTSILATDPRCSLLLSYMTVDRRGQCWGCNNAMSFGSVSLMTVTLARHQDLMLVQDAASVLQPCGGKSSASLGAACRMSTKV